MKNKLNYLTGHSGRKGLLGVLAFPNSLPKETEITLFFMMFKKNWGHQRFDFDISSVTYIWDKVKDDRSWWLIGKRGEVVELNTNKPVTVKKIKTAGTGKGKYGYISKISNIDNNLYICGYSKQVYKFEKKNWKLISRDILEENQVINDGFEDIGGSDQNNIYAVGDSGVIFYFDGKRWYDSNSPTNQNLSSICSTPSGEYWVCGDNGVIITGNHNKWSLIDPDENFIENWWDIEFFQNDVYLAGDERFIRITKEHTFEEVAFPKKDDYIPVSLTQSEGVLWFIDEDSIFSYDGQNWEEHFCPDM